MNKKNKEHWEDIYSRKSSDTLSWYQENPNLSLNLIQKYANTNSRIIDIGSGASFLVDKLIQKCYDNLALLDISKQALELVKNRLGVYAQNIEWYEQDIIDFKPKHNYDIWHDRAVFHFLTDKKMREVYLHVLKKTIKSGGYIIISSFAKNGPLRCSGLEIIQYDDELIQQEFGNDFLLLSSELENHITPAKTEQKFVYFVFQRK